MRRVEGREGQYNEFVEFHAGKVSVFIAQKTGQGWLVSEGQKTGSGAVQHVANLHTFSTKQKAVDFAAETASNLEKWTREMLEGKPSRMKRRPSRRGRGRSSPRLTR